MRIYSKISGPEAACWNRDTFGRVQGRIFKLKGELENIRSLPLDDTRVRLASELSKEITNGQLERKSFGSRDHALNG